MKNVIEILQSMGIEVPEEKREEFNKEFASNYKTVAEYTKKVERLETERDGLKEQLDVATENLKGFEGVNLEELNQKIADAQKKAEDAEKEYKAKIASRDFEEALKTEIEDIKFTSNSAKQSVIEQIKKADLKCVDGKILGLNDLLAQIKAKDEDAFVKEDDGQQTPPPAKFTTKLNGTGAKDYSTREEIMAIKNTAERQEAIATHADLFK